jgi:hypothetical protein
MKENIVIPIKIERVKTWTLWTLVSGGVKAPITSP